MEEIVRLGLGLWLDVMPEITGHVLPSASLIATVLRQYDSVMLILVLKDQTEVLVLASLVLVLVGLVLVLAGSVIDKSYSLI